MATSNSANKQSQLSFEFTKRKRWSETVFSEISETIIFVLSPACKVLFCGAAIVALLGWKEDQLVDADLTSFIEDEDQDNFRWSFTESLRNKQQMFIYARFKFERPASVDPSAKPGQLFELKGHPHYIQGQPEPQCVFLTAMPYPSRNLAMLNSFLDLKIENERLSRRICELKGSLETSSQAMPPSHQFPPQSYGNHFSETFDCPYTNGGTDASSSNEAPVGSPPNGPPALCLGGEDDENSIRRKKQKKALIGEEQRVCVTCGRTDSPEWRKGPLGPKTLCNACGLRWAKRSRKPESESNSPGQGRSVDDGPLSYAPSQASHH